MTLGAYRLDSELAGLLHEAAKDPDSALFRGAACESVQRLALAAEPLRPTTRTLSALERELLLVRRHELAGLLAAAALQLFASGPGGARLLLFTSAREPLALDSLEACCARVRAGLERGAACALPRSWLAVWLAGSRTPAIGELVALAQQLAPSPELAVLGALASALAGELCAAEELLLFLLERYRHDRVGGRAHEALALVHGRRGDLQGALHHLRAAHELEPRRGSAALSWFCCALVCGDERAQFAADRELEAVVGADSEFLRQACLRVAALARAPRTPARLGPVGEQLVEALAADAPGGDPILVGPPGCALAPA